MRVRYTPRAFADREAIFEYIDRRNPRAAREVKAFIQKRITELGDLEIRHRTSRSSACMPSGSVAIRTSSTTESVGTRSLSFTCGMSHEDLGKARAIVEASRGCLFHPDEAEVQDAASCGARGSRDYCTALVPLVRSAQIRAAGTTPASAYFIELPACELAPRPQLAARSDP
jgi:hypothetical protein